MSTRVSVRNFGASGNGRVDDGPSIQKALDAGLPEVEVPGGTYFVGETLLIRSDTKLCLHDDATIRLADSAGPRAGASGFLITNRDHAEGNQDITVEGGVWDGNNAGNPRGPDGPVDSYTGVAINFVNVRNLSIQNLVVKNPESFFIRLGEIRGFTIEDITLEAPNPRPNQDGIHVGGFSEDGEIRRIKALGVSCPNDDMVALNANDDVTRAINLGMKEGPIRRIDVENITADDAYTFVRLLSQDASIEDVNIKRIRGGCRYYALNLDRWRFPPGKGNIARVRIDDVEVRKRHSDCTRALIPITLNVQNMEIRNFRIISNNHHDIPTMEISNCIGSRVQFEGLDSPKSIEFGNSAKIDIVYDTIDEFKRQGLHMDIGPGDSIRLKEGGFQFFHIQSL